MAYQETTSVSWFDRLGSSFKGIGTGILLFIAGTVLLWWNEGSFVATGDALNEAQAVTQELGDINTLDPSKNGQFVHATGPVITDDVLTDPVFGISINAIRLERSVEFYQWVEKTSSEKRQKLGGGEETVTTYTYAQEWVKSPVDSSRFKDPQSHQRNRNFVLAPMEDLKVQAKNVSFGAYRFPSFLINSISGAIPLNITLSEEVQENLNKQLAQTMQRGLPGGASASDANVHDVFRDAYTGTDSIFFENEEMVHVSGNTILLSLSPAMPRIGDVRVTFKETRPDTVSILAKVNGDTFEAYQASNGKTVSELSMGTHSLESMYGAAHSSNATMTWLMRFGGAALIIIGLKMVLATLSVVVSVIPLLGNLVGAGTGLVSTLLGGAWSLVIISIAWLRFRPLIGGALLAAAAVLVGLSFIKGRSKKAATPQGPPPAPGAPTQN